MRLLASHTALAMAVITIAGNVALAQQAKKLPVPAGTSLERGVKYSSPSGNHFLKFASDGNLVITTKQDGFVWGLNEVAPGKFSKTSRVELTREGRLGAFDAQGNTVWSPAYGPDRTANLNLTFEGTLQVVAGNGTILWSSNGVLTRPMSVFRNKAALTEDRSQLASEKGWSQCWVMTDPAIRIFATNRVSSSAINAVANIYVEMLHNLDPNYSRSQFDGFRVYITNGESGAELKKLNTVGTMWTDGTHEKSREFLRGGASQDFLWISEQMICKTGVKTRAAIGKRDTTTRTFDQVVHEMAHTIDMKYIDDKFRDSVFRRDKDGKVSVEGFAIATQRWFSVGGAELSTGEEAALNRIFTTRPVFSAEGYGAQPSSNGQPQIIAQRQPGKNAQRPSEPMNTAPLGVGATPPSAATQTRSTYRNGDPKVSIYVTNNTGQPLEFHWVDGSGKEAKPGTIEAGVTKHSLGFSYPGTLYRFRRNGKLVHSWVVQKDQLHLTIGKATSSPASAASAADSQATLAGLWMFDDPNKPEKATVGQDLDFQGLPPGWASDTADDHGTTLKGVLSTQPPARKNVIRAVHGIAPTRGKKYVNKYSIVADIFSPRKSRNTWRSIFQTRQNNSDDGDYFIRDDNNAMGVSELGYSRAEIDETKWTRLVLTFDLTSRGGDAIVYADGKLLHKHPSDLAVDSRFSLGNGVLFFADDSGDNGQLSVNALAIYSGVLSPQQVAALGAAGTPITANTNRVAAKPQPVRLKLPARFIMKTYGVGGKGGVGAADGYFVGVQRGKSAIIHAPQEAAQANKSGIKTISREELAGDLVALKTDAGYLPNLSSTIGPANKYMVVESFVPDRGNKRLFTLQLVDSSPTQYLRHGGLIIYNDIRQHVEKTGQPAKVFEQDVTWQYTESP